VHFGIRSHDRHKRIAMLAAALLLGLLIGIGIGVAIGRSDGEAEVAATPTPTPSDIGHLAVSSQPAESNVTLDGRFVGVTPIERLDLDPGKHSIVIDVFGYQPYSGTLSMEPRGKLNFRVFLAPLGGTGTTTGKLAGGGTATHAIVPPSALAPAGDDPRPGKAPARGPSSRRASVSSYTPPPPPALLPPARPRRDCGGEESRCKSGCSSAESSCRFNCPNCVSCPSSVGWDECKRQCDACRGSCDQNTKFCESSCRSQHDNCEASQ